MIERVKLRSEDAEEGNQSQEKHDATPETEKVHRLATKGAHKPEDQEIEVAVDKSVHAKLCLPILARLVMDHKLTDLSVARHLRHVGEIAVHVVIDLDVLHHLILVTLEPTIEVMKRYAGEEAHGGIEELRGPGLGERVVPLLLPPTHHVEVLLTDHPIELGDLIRRVLQVGIHRDDDGACSALKSRLQTGRLPVVASKANRPDMRIRRMQPLDDLPGAIGTSIVDKDDLIRDPHLGDDTGDPLVQLGEGLLLIVERDDDRQVYGVILLLRHIGIIEGQRYR